MTERLSSGQNNFIISTVITKTKSELLLGVIVVCKSMRTGTRAKNHSLWYGGYYTSHNAVSTW